MTWDWNRDWRHLLYTLVLHALALYGLVEVLELIGRV
jgi:hypothetical protein